MPKLNPVSLFYIALILTSTAMADTGLFKGGHAKYFLLLNTYPDDSLYLDYVDSPSIDQYGDLRLKFDWQKDRLQIAADYQLIAARGDSLELSNKLPGFELFSGKVISDQYRLLDLTHIITENSDNTVVQRLDRLFIGFTGKKTVVRIGRQTLSWGNGLFYMPMDFFNPFEPAAIDKEYKSGDDMMYGQYLKQGGDDVQGVWVIRRNIDGDVTNKVDTVALKYHGFFTDMEYDLIIAEHFDDYVIGIGGLSDIGGALWRGDILLNRTYNSLSSPETVLSLVTSLSYSWLGWGHNITGAVEYFYNGFGQADGDYSPDALAANPELVERLLRGELFTLGRNYVALSATIEMNPLWLLTPSAFINISDGSLLAQLVTTYDLMQDLQLLAAINLPVGPAGTEYGGIDSGVAGKPLSTGAGLFAQLAWYF